ncbi:undecaprenyl-phosphate galactose phosphotransferase WbaP [Pectinatus brassicae]|uniref:undecaprenyl-phosphate galactose phosphotransferase WbaP n=1 Tax=Pectinatus brassicae TaxID=862415 RepID=UPI001E64291B|nr:undecaprenyl-phosphate galactose phosphotransferase WbaP [Pectinatus brassicae]
MECKKIKAKKLDYNASYIMPILFIIVDYLAILLAERTAICLRQNIAVLSTYNFMPNIPNLYFYILVPAIFLIFLYNSQIYVTRLPFWEVIQRIFYAVIYSVMVSIVLMYFGHIAGGISRIYVCLLAIWAFGFLCSFRYFLKKILIKCNMFLEPVIIIGAGKTAELIINEFKNDIGLGVNILGFIDDDPISKVLPQEYPILGTFDETEEVIKKTKVKTVLIAAPGLKKNELLKLVNLIQPLVKNLAFIPDLIGAPVGNMQIERLYDSQLILLKIKNNLSRRYNRILKKIFDTIVGVIIFIPIAPILILIAIAIKIDSEGSIFFNAKRIGKNNVEFTCYKFRTMYNDSDKILENYLANNKKAADEWRIFRKIKGYDPRVTKVGIWLRRYSLDELPQILNVLTGNMSLVGPRPYLPKEKNEMGTYLNIITNTLPGITGLWQIRGRNEITFSDRLKMDAWYIQNWSVWIDVVLLYKTIFIVLNKNGAY